ncbi:hypothetical protein HHL17_31950 [Chitinophaga sp. G-6-1-13]|uniref:Uncharacterized protein n=1 Tax=Chitinophaga fulva TaxID=2728842 RepID=A0A848GWM9_9BACT|nr:hypothetical protein [Chitinophaga fulva]NML41841.1 hypothetical protein [Chitinophaga fulva]
MKNVLLPIIKLCLVGCSLLLYFGNFFELRMYELEYEWLKELVTGRVDWRDGWLLRVCLTLLLVSQAGILLSIRVPMRLTWQVVFASGLIACVVGLSAFIGQFILTVSWVLLGMLYAALLVGLVPRAVARG